jgi:hypothetical protein
MTKMKLLFAGLLAAAALGTTIVSCSKNDTAADSTTPLVTTPEASAAENGKSGGVYKGVLIGSTGYVKIMFQGGKKMVTVTMDGVTKTLDSVSFTPATWTSGQAITSAVFAKDGWKVTFSVGADGKNPNVTVEITGHSKIAVTVSKEVSDSQVKSFEGTIQYQGASLNSTFNFMVWGDSLRGIGRMPADTLTYPMAGFVINNTQLQGRINNATVTGTISGNTASGTITIQNIAATWTAKRTL